jgi:replicative DNA helicase
VPDSSELNPGIEPVDFKRGRRRKPDLADPARVDRVPPHSLEAEQGVLGSILLAPNEVIGECIQKFKAGSEVFYDLRHRTIYDACIEMYDRKAPVEVPSLQQVLRDRNQLEAVGGVAYLASLPDAVPSAANLSYYADIVREKHVLRRMIATCNTAVARAYEEQEQVESVVDEVQRDILQIAQDREDRGAARIKELVNSAIAKIEHYFMNKGQPTGLGTGFTDLDKMTTGLQPGDMIVIAARPSMGKTSLAMNIAEHVAMELRQPVGVFSLEMTAQSLVMRLLCSRARINMRNVTSGFLSERDLPRIGGVAQTLAEAPLFIDDTGGLSILQLRARARRMFQQFQIKLFVIDYLQLLHSSSAKADNRQQEIADISNGVKQLAKDLNVPVIVLAQLNREMEKEKNRKPRLSDLRESGSIEQDADLVAMLYREQRDDDEGGPAPDQDAVPVNLLIAKQRNGPTGDVPLTFFKSYTRFESAAKISGDDIPPNA